MVGQESSYMDLKSLKFATSFSKDADGIIIHDDIFKYAKNIPDKFFSLIITSPPYNIGKEYEKKKTLSQYIEEQRSVISCLCSKLKDDGSLVWQVGNYVDKGEVFPLDIYFYPIFKEKGLKLRNRIIWHFEHGLHCKNRFSGRYETLLWFTKTDNYKFNLDAVRIPSKYPGKLHYKGPKKGQPSGNPLGKNPSDFWNIITEEFESGIIEIPNVKSNHPEKTSHPCQFPIELIERCILALTDKEDWVLDPFGGVGTTLIAALKQSRKGMSVELDRQYIEISWERLANFQNGTLKTRPVGKKIHQPTGREKVAQIPDSWKMQQGVLL